MAKRKAQKKSNRWIHAIIIFFLVLCAYITSMYLWQRYEDSKAKFILYPGFGIELPVAFTIHGIDVSTYQQTVYWPAVKQMQVSDVSINFVFIKATEGLVNTDKQFKRNWQKAKDAGIPRGAYHYFLSTKDGKVQANNFIKQVHLESGDLPPVLDVEQLYNTPVSLMQQRVKTWLQTVETAYHVKPIIYSSADFYNRYLGKDFDSYPLWVAHYFAQQKPRVQRDWQFWQHSSLGHINGIVTNVDFNVFNGDTTAFKAMLVK